MNTLFEIHVTADDHALVYDIDRRHLIIVCPADDDTGNVQNVRIPVTARALAGIVEKINELRDLMR